MEFTEEQLKYLEELAWIPCCHTTGMHDPTHFEQGKYICTLQKSHAFERFCKELGINPQTKSESNCYWCNNYPDKRKGEGRRLFQDSSEGETHG